MATSMIGMACRRFSTFQALKARPGYPPSIKFRHEVLPRIPRTIESGEPEYPPLNPPLFGSSDETKLYRLQLHIERIKDASSTPDVMMEMLKKNEAWHHMIYPYGLHPGFSGYKKYVTKTVTVPDLPPSLKAIVNSSEVEKEAKALSQLVKELIHFDMESMYQHKEFKPSQTKIKSRHFVHNLFRSLIIHLSSKYPHLATAEADIDVKISSFWHQGRDNFLQYYGESAFALRCLQPLSVFADTNHEISETEVEDWPWDPRSISIFRKHHKPICFPGFKFGSEHVHPHTQVITPTFHEERMKRAGLYDENMEVLGLTAGFAWLNAFAMYQGYCYWNDIPKPMTGQIVYTNGRSFSFYCYQLNTLALKEDDATSPSPLTNVCWQLVNVPLYYDIKDGEVRDWNEEALKILLAFLMNRPGQQMLEADVRSQEVDI